MDAHDVDAVVQVGAEPPLGDVGLRSRAVAATRRTSTLRVVVARTSHLALLQARRSLTCSGTGDRPARREACPLRLLEQSLAFLGRAGEGALGVAEQLALEQRSGMAAQFTATNGRLPARARVVDVPRDNPCRAARR